MKTIITLCTLAYMLIGTPAQAYEFQGWAKWDAWDKGLYIAACAGHGLDMWSTHKFMQLRDEDIFEDPPYERNKLLGETPGDAALVAYWIVEVLLTYAAASILPGLLPEDYQGTCRKALLMSAASVSIGYARRNEVQFNLELVSW